MSVPVTIPNADTKELSMQFARAAGMMKTYTGATNNASILFMRDALDLLKRTPLYKFEVKRQVTKVMEALRKYEDALVYPTPGQIRFFDLNDMAPEWRARYREDATSKDYYEFWAATGGELYVKTKKHMDALSWKFEKLYDKNGMKYAHTLSMMATTHILLQLSVETYQTSVKVVDRDLPMLLTSCDGLMKALSIEPVEKAWDRLNDLLLDNDIRVSDLEDADIKSQLSVITQMWSDPLVYSEVQSKAIGEYETDIFRTKGMCKKIQKEIADKTAEIEEELRQQKLERFATVEC